MINYRIGWFSTGRDEAARDLLKTVQESLNRGEIRAEVAFVFSNRQPGEDRESDLFFELVEGYGLPLVCLSSRKFKAQPPGNVSHWRQEYEQQVMKQIERFHPDVCLLAGYMLIVGQEMCQRHAMINLHPAAPDGPGGTWQEAIWKLIENRAFQAGAMMHLVTPELDQGPPLTYCTFPIRGEPFDAYWKEIEKYPSDELKGVDENNPLFKLIRRHELAREFPLILATLQALSEGDIKIKAGKVVDAQEMPVEGYDLSSQIDRQIAPKLSASHYNSPSLHR